MRRERTRRLTEMVKAGKIDEAGLRAAQQDKDAVKAYELVYRGTLPSVTIGRSRRVPVAALQAFVDALVENGGVP